MSKGTRISRGQAEKIAAKAILRLLPHTMIALVAGSIRRKKPDVGDIDIVIARTEKQLEGLNQELGKMFGLLKSVKGKSSRSGELYGVSIQIIDVLTSGFGAALLMATGPAEFNVEMRARAKSMGYKLNRYGLWYRDREEMVCECLMEATIFTALMMRYVLPEDRI